MGARNVLLRAFFFQASLQSTGGFRSAVAVVPLAGRVAPAGRQGCANSASLSKGKGRMIVGLPASG